ncbi:MAG: hypothetical protein LDL39_15020 [Magnetospirillum sp.]|nr:hypothetical protein [Magnetospirillum sp.]
MRATLRTALLGMILLSNPAFAADQWKADPPGQWRSLTWDEKTTTSTCIGKPISPICAVETKTACYDLEDEALCHLAIRDHHGRVFLRSTNTSHALYTKYRISALRKVEAGETVTLLDKPALPGDYLVDLRDRQCEVKTNKCSNDIGPPTTHLVRLIDGEWRIITWDTPRW